MPSCCGGNGLCSCKIQAGSGMTVTGSGTAGDPYVLTAAVKFAVADNARFDLTLTGTGDAASPYTLSMDYAATSKFDDIPDVNVTGATNGQVASWDSGTSKWVARNPTTAAAGSVLHDQSLTGDGSAGSPLGSVLSSARFLGLFGAAGIGLTDIGVNQLVRHFVDDIARQAAIPAPALNTLSMLDSVPGRVQFWDGSQWSPLGGSFDYAYAGATTEFLALSGSYLGSRTTHLVKQVSVTTDASGNMDVLDPSDLAGRGGVLSCMFQETGALAFKAVLFANTDRVSAHVYNLVGGAPYPAQSFTGVVDCWLY